MPRRKATASAEGKYQPTYLAKPIAEVGPALDQQISKGRELESQLDVSALATPGRLEELKGTYRSWDSYNATYLERAFSTKELFDEYSWWPGIAFGGPESDADRLRDLVQDLKRDLAFLVRLRDRLTLYEAPPGTTTPQHEVASSGRRPVAPGSVSLIFQGQVGQVNLADLIESVDSRIEQVDRRGEGQLADALKHLATAIKAAQDVEQQRREEALDAVSVLAEVGALPAEQRGKLRGRVRGAFTVIKELIDVAPAVRNAWDTWGPVITEHLPRLS